MYVIGGDFLHKTFASTAQLFLIPLSLINRHINLAPFHVKSHFEHNSDIVLLSNIYETLQSSFLSWNVTVCSQDCHMNQALQVHPHCKWSSSCTLWRQSCGGRDHSEVVLSARTVEREPRLTCKRSIARESVQLAATVGASVWVCVSAPGCTGRKIKRKIKSEQR